MTPARWLPRALALSALAVFAALAACGGSGGTKRPVAAGQAAAAGTSGLAAPGHDTGTREATPVGIESVHSASRSGILAPAFEVVRDEQAWQALWAAHKPGEPRPYVDFSRHLVVASFLGEKPNGCYSVLMHDAYIVDGKVTIRRKLTVPGPGAVCPMSITAPAHIAKIVQSSGDIELATETVTL